jgi:hypothetical protein
VVSPALLDSKQGPVCLTTSHSPLPGGRRKQVKLENHSRATNLLHICKSSLRHAFLKMKPTDEYKASLSNAIAFKLENPKEKATAAARIYNVNNNSVRTNLY